MIKMKLKYKFLVVALLLSLTFSLSSVGAVEDVPFEQSETESVPQISETQETSNENLNTSPYLKGLGLTKINIEPHFILEDLSDDNKKLQRNEILKESHNRKIIALTDGAYILQTNSEYKLYGESYIIKTGIISKSCNNGECIVLDENL